MKVRAIAVVVPARDEEATIDACLALLAVARAELADRHPDIEVRTCVVADRCVDRTRERAGHHGSVQIVHCDAGNVGHARAAGVAHLLDGLDPAATWIANTDADSTVPPQWLASQVDDAERGADAVVGTVRPDFADLSGEQVRRWLERHIPGQPNGHVHGANLGVAAKAYLEVGGFRPLVEHEDVDLVRRLTIAGFTIHNSDAAEVITSSRLVGRTPGGYSAYLARGA